MHFSKIQSLLAAVILLGTPLTSLAAPAPDALAVPEPAALALAEPALVEREAIPQGANDDDDNNNNDDDDDDNNNGGNGGNNNNNQRTVSTCVPRNGNNNNNNNAGYRACINVTFFRNNRRQVRVSIVLDDTQRGDGSVRGQYSLYSGGRGNNGGNNGGNNNNNNNGRRTSDVYRANDQNRRTSSTRTWNLDRDIQYLTVSGWRARDEGRKGTSDRLNYPFN
ncbi:hypothetical protein CB0940_04723 [Cercospora beticola]|uniref:Uncharacterized protein n=1 Tax=Cercospora beticola TaxID=122368 RepID=A0A2G5HKX1_CERBT|nr:hypothetical protein CB0940_04723 [Cercospora beticola]PIA92862.1 hypothetical protein CB0940_04723 [Cercospora beticola]WPB01987.1 hypothetical protein RHO25_006621 [Cercospora beticola]CAK1363165.1 unnamed protein product [Cercospora beticola]